MHGLPILVRLAGRPVILVGDGEAAAAKRRILERADARVADEGEAAALAIVAVDDDAAAADAVARLRARGVLVNAVDRPALCDFTLPAIVDRDPVLIAVATGGASAGLAKALRQRLEALLPADLGGLADALHAARAALRARFPDAAARRRAIDDALAPGAALDPLGDGRDVAGWLAGAAAASPDRTVRIALRSADPDDLTLREARWLAQADGVEAAPGVPPAILARARADAARGPAPGLTVVIGWAD